LERRSASVAPLLAIIAVSLIASYLFYTTGSFALYHSHDIHVGPTEWESFQIWVTEGDVLSGSFEVISEGNIDFYVMTEIEYREYTRFGNYPAAVYTSESVDKLDWSVSIPDEGIHFVLYSNEGFLTEHIQGSIVVTTSRSIVWPVAVTAGIIAIAIWACLKILQTVRGDKGF